MYKSMIRKISWPGYMLLVRLYALKEPYDLAVYVLITGLLYAFIMLDIVTITVQVIALISYIYVGYSTIFYRHFANEEDLIVKKLAGNIDN